MTVECVWFDTAPERPWRPGMVFPDPYRIELSQRIKGQLASGERAFPIAVCTPMRGDELWKAAHPGEERGQWFGLDCHPTGKPDGHWNVVIVGELVEGAKPDITVTPSMNAVGIYHGYLTNGVLSDDIV